MELIDFSFIEDKDLARRMENLNRLIIEREERERMYNKAISSIGNAPSTAQNEIEAFLQNIKKRNRDMKVIKCTGKLQCPKFDLRALNRHLVR